MPLIKRDTPRSSLFQKAKIWAVVAVLATLLPMASMASPQEGEDSPLTKAIVQVPRWTEVLTQTTGFVGWNGMLDEVLDAVPHLLQAPLFELMPEHHGGAEVALVRVLQGHLHELTPMALGVKNLLIELPHMQDARVKRGFTVHAQYEGLKMALLLGIGTKAITLFMEFSAIKTHQENLLDFVLSHEMTLLIQKYQEIADRIQEHTQAQRHNMRELEVYIETKASAQNKHRTKADLMR
ncbi:MAG: hypothetical protein ACK5O7_00865 [Holosporales bacterium]